MKQPVEIQSPAKINLFFRVLGKRPDGYHEIASLYQAIDQFDRLFFTPANKDKITCTDPTIPTDEKNLVFKALHIFRKRFLAPPVHIHIEKNIPVEAGLGGGSSNAAATLKALNQLTGHPATTTELIAVAKEIGSDVPFFFSSGTAYCTGRGDVFEPYALKKPIQGFIAKPNFGLSTPLVYQNVRIDELPQRDPKEALRNFPIFFNDLEFAAFRLKPQLKIIQQTLKTHFEHVVMTGSGTAFFCLGGMPKPCAEITFFPFFSTSV